MLHRLITNSAVLVCVAGCTDLLGDDFVVSGVSSSGAGASSAASTTQVSGAGGGGGNGGGTCGDGMINGTEECDDGPDNGLGLLLCAPDCSRIIQKKYIVVSRSFHPNADLAPDPVVTADSYCAPGYRALFAYGDVRRATTVANQTTNSIDWVLQPYTYYYNEQENPVWLTRDVALLGIDNGAFTSLENPILPLVTVFEVTGMNPDYTTLTQNNCNGWTSQTAADMRVVGFSVLMDLGFLYYMDQTFSCSQTEVYFYCVEQ